MSNIFGILNMEDSERTYVNDIGKGLVFDAVQELVAQWNADINEAMSVFIEKRTEQYTERYLLPGSGKLQEVGRQAPPVAVKRSGQWDVAYPLREYGAALGGSRVDLAYMTVQELDAHIQTIMAQDMNTLRWRILTAIFEDDNLTWTDPLYGSLTIRRLANADGTNYPPIVGSEDDLTGETHYDTAGYATAAISDANNPAETLRDELVEHFGGRGMYGDNVAVFHNSDATTYLEDLTAYTPVAEQYIAYGDDTSLAANMPNVPGRVHGRLSGTWVSEWDWIPSGFMVGVHLGASAPLVMRVDPSATGLGTGDLQLVATEKDHPLESAYYSRRFGLGAGNRLSAAVLEISADGSYAPPSDYAE